MLDWLGYLQRLKRRYVAPPYDSELHAAERHYANQYLYHFGKYCNLDGAPLQVLDAGCGTGRFTMEFLRRGHNVTAFDTSAPSLRLLEEKATNEQLRAQLTTVTGDIHRLNRLVSDTFDVVACLEVLYTSEQREQVTAALLSHLHKDGIAFITHKPKHYFLLSAIARRQFDDARIIADASEGRLRKGPYRVYYNWQTEEEVRSLYARLGAQVNGLVSIGAFSGFSVDPLTSVCNPEELTTDDLDQLHRLEVDAHDEIRMCSRYVLAVVSNAGVT